MDQTSKTSAATGRGLGRRSAWLGVFVASILSAWGFWSSSGGDKLANTSIDASTNISATGPESWAASKSTLRSDKQSLNATTLSAVPAEGAPLANTFNDLVRLSNEGNPAASMRLFSDLTKCSLRATKGAVLDYYSYSPKVNGETASLPGAQQLGHAGQVAKNVLAELERTDQLCRGITAAQVDRRGEYLRQAALQNDPEAMVCYATTYELGPKYLSDSWFAYASRWQQEAPYFAQKALDLGQADILAPLIEALTPDDPNVFKTYRLSEAVKPNHQLAYALALLYQRVAPAEQLEQAQQDVSKLSEGLQRDELSAAQNTADGLWPIFANSSGDKRVTRPCPEFIFPEIPL